MELQICWENYWRTKWNIKVQISNWYWTINWRSIEKINQILLGDKKDELFGLGAIENDIFEELKIVKYNRLEDMVYRLQLTHDEVIIYIRPKLYSLQRKRLFPTTRHIRSDRSKQNLGTLSTR